MRRMTRSMGGGSRERTHRMSRAWSAPVFAQDGARDEALRSYLSGNGFLTRGMYELAAKEYRGFLKDHPDHEKAATARYGLGVALVRMKKYDEAAGVLGPLADIN